MLLSPYMNYLYLTGMTLLMGLFAAYLLFIGITMTRINTMQAELDAYRKDPKQATWMQKYFFGFVFFDGKIAEWTIKHFDPLYSTWIKISGVIFVLFAILFFLAILTLWYVNLANI